MSKRVTGLDSALYAVDAQFSILIRNTSLSIFVDLEKLAISTFGPTASADMEGTRFTRVAQTVGVCWIEQVVKMAHTPKVIADAALLAIEALR